MKKFFVVGRRQLELQEVPTPEPGPHQVLVKTHVSAVSVGTEVWRYVNGGHYGGEGSECGYNSSGVVAAVGAGVAGVGPGDRVFTPQPHAEYLLAEAHQVIRLGHDVDFEAGAFTYLPTLGLHALRSADYQAGDNVVIVGQGIVGVLAAQVAQMVGARIVALEVDPLRRRVAQQAGVRTVLDPNDADLAEDMDAVLGAAGPDVIVETSQAWSGLTTALDLARLDSRVSILSIYRSAPTDEIARALLRATFMDRDRFHNQRVRIIACSNDPGAEYPPTAVRWTIQRNMHYIAAQIAEGALKPSQAITHRFQWDELPAIYERFVAGDRSMVGVTLHWS